MITLRRLVGDVTAVRSILLLFKRNSIPPVAVPVGDAIDFAGSPFVIISLVWDTSRGVIVVSERIVGDGENRRDNRGDGSFFATSRSPWRRLVKLIGVEKLVLIVNGCDVEREFGAMSWITYRKQSGSEGVEAGTGQTSG